MKAGALHIKRTLMKMGRQRGNGDNISASKDTDSHVFPKLSPSCCIHRVPRVLRSVNKEAYTPQVVSIGPFHRDKEWLKPMEEHKQRYLNDFLSKDPKRDIGYYLQNLVSIETKIRNCYGETVEHDSNKFTDMMLLDGCFIVELILKFSMKNLRHADDPIFKTAWMLNAIKLDMALLENQLPFFVLEHLFNLINGPDQQWSSLSILELIVNLYEHDVICCRVSEQDTGEVNHLVHLLRKSHAPSDKRLLPKSETGIQVIPSATKLHNAGVKFQTRSHQRYGKKGELQIPPLHNAGTELKTRSDASFLDLKFSKKGELQIPPMKFDRGSSIIIQNIIAFEQFDQHHNYMSQYVILMDSLMSTGADVALLCKEGIINNWLRDDNELALLFNKLSGGVTTDTESFHYARLFEEVNEFHKLPLHRKRKAFYQNCVKAGMAKLKKDYFNTPCTTISFVAATLLLSATIAQTLYTIIWQ